MNNFEWDQAKRGEGILSLLAATKVQLQYDERSQVWGYKVPSKPDLYTQVEQQKRTRTTPSTESQQRTRGESSKSGEVVQSARDRWSHVTATCANRK